MHFPGIAYFVREMRLLGRSTPQMLLRLGIGAAYLLVIVAAEVSAARGAGPVAPGQELLESFGAINRFLIHAVALLYFSTVLGEEKEASSRDLLLATGLGPFSMLLGAAVSRQLVALVLVGIQIPVLLLCHALGGVTAGQVLAAVASLLGTLLALSSLMLLASVLGQTTRACLLIGGVLLVGWIRLGDPFLTLVAPGIGWNGVVIPGARLILDLLVAGALFLLSVLILHLRICGGLRSARHPRTGVAPASPARRPGRVWPRFPVAWKDSHFHGGGLFWRNIRLAAALVLVLGWRMDRDATAFFTPAGVGASLLLAGLAGLVLEITVACNGFVRGEQEEKTLETLFTLPLPSRILLRDKLLAATHLSWPFAAVALAGALLAPELPRAWIGRGLRDVWTRLAALIALGHLLAFWLLTLVFSYTSRAPGWLGAGLVTGMSLVFFLSVGGMLHAAAGGAGTGLLPLLLLWLAAIGGWILREVFRDFERNLIYPE